MKINRSEIETVAVKPSQYPAADKPEIAFAGRSNVGKSSLLNLLTGRKSLARVSGSPGKTRTISRDMDMQESQRVRAEAGER